MIYSRYSDVAALVSAAFESIESIKVSFRNLIPCEIKVGRANNFKGRALGEHYLYLGSIPQQYKLRNSAQQSLRLLLVSHGIARNEIALVFRRNGTESFDCYLFKKRNLNQINNAEQIIDNDKIVISQSFADPEKHANKRAVHTPWVKYTPHTEEGLALCMPAWHDTNIPSEVELLHIAGYPYRRIVAVEQQYGVYCHLRNSLPRSVRVEHSEVAEVIAAEDGIYSFVDLDYCGLFNESAVNALVNLRNKLALTARVLTTFTRCRETDSFYAEFANIYFGKLFSLLYRRSVEVPTYFHTPAACVWIILFITQTLNIDTETFLLAKKLPQPNESYRLSIHIDHYRDSVPMQFSAIDLVRLPGVAPRDVPQCLDGLVSQLVRTE